MYPQSDRTNRAQTEFLINTSYTLNSTEDGSTGNRKTEIPPVAISLHWLVYNRGLRL